MKVTFFGRVVLSKFHHLTPIDSRRVIPTPILLSYNRIIQRNMSRNAGNINFSSKVVLVTGASSGIGKETAIQFSRLGANLSLCGRNVENLQKTVDECKQVFKDPSQKIFSQKCDVLNEKEVESYFNETVKFFDGQLDVLVNNAGILEVGTIENTSLEQYDRVMNTNVRSIYQLMMLATPYLVKSKGNVVNVSSVNGVRSFPGVLAYCVSKSAVDQLTRCTALELAPKGVRVNSVNPGVITTGIQLRSGLNEEQYQAFLERSKTTHALGRTGTPDEVAATIAFLASDCASYITGTSLPIDGGRHAMCPR